MSKSKVPNAGKASFKPKSIFSKAADEHSSSKAGLTEDSFKNLKDNISAQLRKKDQQAGDTQKNATLARKGLQDLNRGKKRTADGTVIQKLRIPSENTDTIGQASEVDNDEQLRAALKELGGTEEDLDLIAGADSESELEGLDAYQSTKQALKKKGSTLEAGIANILKEIALSQGNRPEDSTISEEEDEQNEDNESESFSEKEDQAPAASTAKLADTLSRKWSGDSRLRCQPRADWFDTSTPNIDLEREPKYTPSKHLIDQLHAHAKSLLVAENEAFKSTQQSSSSQAFYNTVIASGTLSDKISALTLAVQESPVHNVQALESLIGLAGKRNRAQAIDVLRALKDLLAQGSLLPSNRRLYVFAAQPFLVAAAGQTKSWKPGDKLPHGLEEQDLICWAFEDWLKQQYFEILKYLEVWCNDEIEFAKSRALSYVYELLKEKPEQESNLLRLLVNKLGDPVKKIASQASYLLMQLLSTHPAMKIVVISAVEADFLFRPGQSTHGKYYAVVTLNQTALSTREEDVAKKLLDIYFSLFTTLLKPSKQDQDQDITVTVNSQSRAQRQRKKKPKAAENLQDEELREKLVSAVLTGVNRAYPYVGIDQKNFTDHLETLFKITHSANFNTSIQAMLLIQQLTSTHSASADRFYRTLYESLLDPRLIMASKQQLYLNLLHRSLKADMNTNRLKAFVKRLLQILSLHEASFICGVFFLLKDLEKTYPSLTALVEQAEDHENEEEVFRDVDEDSDMRKVDKKRNDEVTTNLYDGNKRAPEHANADNSCAWEVLPFLAHFHPSVTVSANHYIQHSKLPGKPDLTLHTLIHFLDRFVYRNPKLAANKLRGSSLMQPMASDDTHAVLISTTSGKMVPAVNTDEFRNKKDEDVAADDAFFHKYFTTLGQDNKAKKRKTRATDEDGSVGDEGEDAVWKAMIDSAPDLEGEDSEDEDMEISDFEHELDAEHDFSDDGDMHIDEDDDEDGVDIEAGIFDDSADGLEDVQGAGALDEDIESEFGGLDSEAEEDDALVKQKKEKRKAEKDKRKKMKAMPTFASAADYAKMLEDDEDEDLA